MAKSIDCIKCLSLSLFAFSSSFFPHLFNGASLRKSVKIGNVSMETNQSGKDTQNAHIHTDLIYRFWQEKCMGNGDEKDPDM